jgi:uncharacterized protein YqjF (DUF2071 family)
MFKPESPERVRSPLMFQEWSSISFIHWPYDPSALAPFLPEGLVPDTFDRHAWIGLTPFRLRGLRLRYTPRLPWLSSFPETNLRTYVKGPAGRGVWFFSLDAARAFAAVGARLLYGLPYYWARMSIQTLGCRVRYQSSRFGRANVDITVEPGVPTGSDDDLARFLTERYRLYSLSWGRLSVARVEHRPWPLQAASVLRLQETLRRAAGLPVNNAVPLVHFSSGVRVRVGTIRRA